MSKIEEHERCEKCGNLVMKYEEKHLCVKCDSTEIAMLARKYYFKQIKGE